jgi:hypothetical protein
VASASFRDFIATVSLQYPYTRKEVAPWPKIVVDNAQQPAGPDGVAVAAPPAAVLAAAPVGARTVVVARLEPPATVAPVGASPAQATSARRVIGAGRATSVATRSVGPAARPQAVTAVDPMTASEPRGPGTKPSTTALSCPRASPDASWTGR